MNRASSNAELLSPTNGKIDLLISELETSDAIKRNFERWPILGQWIWPNSYVGTTYESEINYLKNWF